MTVFIFAILLMPLIGYTLWHLMGIIVSAMERQKPIYRSALQTTMDKVPGKVAILYTTCNDFNPAALMTLINQKHVATDIFILDDSTSDTVRDQIDEWVNSHPVDVLVVRRSNRMGYKGGNINHWLSKFGDPNRYPYILIADADECLPSNFTSQLLAHMDSGPYAFVQGCHLGLANIQSYFQSMLHLQVEMEWLHQIPARNLTGMPPMLGHGVLIKIKPFLEVGGFPDLVSEDLALTIRLAEKGQVGVIAPHIIGYEEFPQHYQAYWMRRKRWIKADAEVVRNMFKNMIRNKLGWLARLDLLAREFRLPLASSYWIILILLATMTPNLDSNLVLWHPATWGILPVFLSPALPALWVNRISLPNRIKYILTASFIGASTIHLHPLSTLQGLFGITGFEPTGARQNARPDTSSSRYFLWELISSLIIVAGGINADNWVLVAIGFSIICSPALRNFRQQQVLQVGTLVFWALIAYQVFLDAQNGSIPSGHLIPLLGLAITLI